MRSVLRAVEQWQQASVDGFEVFLYLVWWLVFFFFFFQAEDGIRDVAVTGVQTCALPILPVARRRAARRGDGARGPRAALARHARRGGGVRQPARRPGARLPQRGVHSARATARHAEALPGVRARAAERRHATRRPLARRGLEAPWPAVGSSRSRSCSGRRAPMR